MSDQRQRDAIRAYMEAGNWISPLEALAKFQCFRLGARVWELKADLEHSNRQVVKRTRTLLNGKKVAEYTIAMREAP